MTWIEKALEDRTWKRIEITVGGTTAFAWIRKLTASEQMRLWKTAFVAPAVTLDEHDIDKANAQTPDPDKVERNLAIGKDIIRWTYYVDTDEGKRSAIPLFDENTIELLTMDEVVDLSGKVTDHTGLGNEVGDLTRSFREEPGGG